MTTRAVVVMASVLAAATMLGAPSVARGQTIKPWVPPAADSLVRWASEAKVRFRANTGDSVGGANYRAYDLVGTIGRRLLRSLGKNNLIQAQAIKPVFDSLGLETEVATDPKLPHFVLLMARNPYRRTASAVGYLYWFRGDDLRMQGALFRGGMQPEMRVWWTGWKQAPYGWGVVDRSRDGELRFTLFRLAPNGSFWNLIQYADSSSQLGGAGSVAWVDMDRDERPELVAWVANDGDSLFEECPDCPKLLNELTFTERPEGFGLHDTRVVPSPYATFTLFIRLLIENNRSQAARLLKDPARLQQAVAAGWGARRTPRTWKIELAEPETRWPRWLGVRFRGPAGDKRYVVRFELHHGRWIIRDWESRTIVRPDSLRTPPRPK